MTDPRLIVLYPQVSTLRGRTVTPTMPTWPAKDPTHALMHSVDFAQILPPGATITIATAESVNSAVTLADIGKTNTVVSFQIGGGTDGAVATVAIKLLLSNGDVAGASLLLPIVAQPGAADLPVPGLTLPANMVIDLATGLPVIAPASGLPISN